MPLLTPRLSDGVSGLSGLSGMRVLRSLGGGPVGPARRRLRSPGGGPRIGMKTCANTKLPNRWHKVEENIKAARPEPAARTRARFSRACNIMPVCCAPSYDYYDSECVAASISERQCLLSPSACIWVCGHAVGREFTLTTRVNQHSGPDAGSSYGPYCHLANGCGLFTLLFNVIVAGFCCACCGARYCILKARGNAVERADAGGILFGLGFAKRLCQGKVLPMGTPTSSVEASSSGSAAPPPPPPEGHVGIYSPPVAVATPLGAAYTKPKALL